MTCLCVFTLYRLYVDPRGKSEIPLKRYVKSGAKRPPSEVSKPTGRIPVQWSVKTVSNLKKERQKLVVFSASGRIFQRHAAVHRSFKPYSKTQFPLLPVVARNWVFSPRPTSGGPTRELAPDGRLRGPMDLGLKAAKRRAKPHSKECFRASLKSGY